MLGRSNQSIARVKMKLTKGLTVEQLGALERVSAELAERGRQEAADKEDAFLERCRAKLERELEEESPVG